MSVRLHSVATNITIIMNVQSRTDEEGEGSSWDFGMRPTTLQVMKTAFY